MTVDKVWTQRGLKLSTTTAQFRYTSTATSRMTFEGAKPLMVK
jgi:hypothetical protein